MIGMCPTLDEGLPLVQGGGEEEVFLFLEIYLGFIVIYKCGYIVFKALVTKVHNYAKQRSHSQQFVKIMYPNVFHLYTKKLNLQKSRQIYIVCCCFEPSITLKQHIC